MKTHCLMLSGMLMGLGLGVAGCQGPGQPARSPTGLAWKFHDMSRPKPSVLEPGAEADSVPAPAGAVVLFNGSDLSFWTDGQGGPASWKVEEGHMVAVAGAGGIRSKPSFGDVHLHLEWKSPDPPKGSGQDRGNSGVFLMGLYEIQVLDSYRADTYADGQAGAVYGQYPPRFNASRPPGEWQSYDLVFRRPRFNGEGCLLEPARVTVIHNGLVVQNNESLLGPTSWLKHLPYQAHAKALPITLQDHGSPVAFRNIWALPLPELPEPDPSYGRGDPPMALTARQLERFVGVYDRSDNPAPITVTREGRQLLADFHWRPGPLELVPVSAREFVLRDTDGRLVFELDEEGEPKGLTFRLGGVAMPARKRP